MIRVRPAVPADYAAVRDVTVRGYVGDGHADEAYAAVLADVAGRAREATLLLAEETTAEDSSTGDRATVVGAVALAFWPSPFAEVGQEGEAVFRVLAVAPEARRRGVGEALVRACLAGAREGGATALVLSTMPRMHAAIRLYERLGFRRMPERDWSPREPFHLLVYGYDLPADPSDAVPGSSPSGTSRSGRRRSVR